MIRFRESTRVDTSTPETPLEFARTVTAPGLPCAAEVKIDTAGLNAFEKYLPHEPFVRMARSSDLGRSSIPVEEGRFPSKNESDGAERSRPGGTERPQLTRLA